MRPDPEPVAADSGAVSHEHSWTAWTLRGAGHGYTRRDCECGASQHRVVGEGVKPLRQDADA